MKKQVLGIKIDDITLDQALQIVKGWLSKPGKHYIVTPNPEIVVMAQKDKELLKILKMADLAIPDGVGLKLSGDIECIIPGIDLMEALIKSASENGFTVGLLGGMDGVAEEAAERLNSRYPKLKVVFAESGGEVDENGNVIASEAKQSPNLNRLLRPPRQVRGPRNDEVVDILFVGFGPPKQEKWIANNLSKLDIKVAMGVGGAFDVISGKVPRAPVWIRNFGFEWLFRLVVQPWRIKRQLALVKFIFYMVK